MTQFQWEQWASKPWEFGVPYFQTNPPSIWWMHSWQIWLRWYYMWKEAYDFLVGSQPWNVFWWVSSSNLTKCMSESWECLEPWARTIQNWQTGAAMYLLSTVNSYSYNLVHMWGEIVCWWNGCSHEQYIYIYIYICNYIYTHTLHVCEICMYTVYIYTYIRWYLIILPDNSDIRSIIYVILAVLAHV